MALTTQAQMRSITDQIVQADKKFAQVTQDSALCNINLKRSQRTHYQVLVSSILSQQLSVKAAATIHARLVDLLKGELTPERLAKLKTPAIRQVGISGAKTRAIQELTQATLAQEINFKKFSKLANSEISAELTKIWGIGRWTVEMFLIFHLGRLDVWPVGDLGVRRGWEKIHGLSEEITPEALDLLGNNFAGHQSVVAWYCWRALDN